MVRHRIYITLMVKNEDPDRVLAEAANDFISVIDRHYRVVYVNRFGGKLLIEGTPGKGATVTLKIPN